jgi:hypothetical protein
VKPNSLLLPGCIAFKPVELDPVIMVSKSDLSVSALSVALTEATAEVATRVGLLQ